jgi:hypothetical protein
VRQRERAWVRNKIQNKVDLSSAITRIQRQWRAYLRRRNRRMFEWRERYVRQREQAWARTRIQNKERELIQRRKIAVEKIGLWWVKVLGSRRKYAAVRILKWWLRVREKLYAARVVSQWWKKISTERRADAVDSIECWWLKQQGKRRVRTIRVIFRHAYKLLTHITLNHRILHFVFLFFRSVLFHRGTSLLKNKAFLAIFECWSDCVYINSVQAANSAREITKQQIRALSHSLRSCKLAHMRSTIIDYCLVGNKCVRRILRDTRELSCIELFGDTSRFKECLNNYFESFHKTPGHTITIQSWRLHEWFQASKTLPVYAIILHYENVEQLVRFWIKKQVTGDIRKILHSVAKPYMTHFHSHDE